MFEIFSAKILVVGGRPYLEIIDLINPKLKSEIMIYKNGSRFSSTGAILQNDLLIFGGIENNKDTKNVSVIGMPNGWSNNMMIPRSMMSSVVLNESKIWITGGFINNDGLNSTEIFSLDQPSVPGPDLPFKVYDHSMVLVNPSTIYLIGGCQNNQISNRTWIIDPTNNFHIKVGPSLNIARHWHSCSKMRIKGRIFLVVAGGYNHNTTLDSVELLDTTCPDKGWKMGMKYKIQLSLYFSKEST